ncbi:hypothetical protein BDV95DRAFT_479523, partial [Massariosphaeria phaeospora]
RVRRNELQSPASSPRSSPDPDLTELLRARIGEDYTFAGVTQDGEIDEVMGGSDADETELILFAAPSSAAPQSQKIRLSSPDAEPREPGMLVKPPRSYYFTDEVTSDREEELQAAAVDGDAVLEMSRVPWAGCAVPWKVTTISAAGLQKTIRVGHPPKLIPVEEKAHKKKRKGKKARIILRKKMQATTTKQEEQSRTAQEKEEADREKRTRRNREKKVKKKAREKAKKAVDDTVTAEAQPDGEEGGGSHETD